jgi:hypothetical protein
LQGLNRGSTASAGLSGSGTLGITALLLLPLPFPARLPLALFSTPLQLLSAIAASAMLARITRINQYSLSVLSDKF